MGGGVVHLLRGGGVPRDGRLQRGVVRERGDRPIPAPEAPGSPRPANHRDSVPPSPSHQRPQAAALRLARVFLVRGEGRRVARAHAAEPAALLHLVRRPALTPPGRASRALARTASALSGAPWIFCRERQAEYSPRSCRGGPLLLPLLNRMDWHSMTSPRAESADTRSRTVSSEGPGPHAISESS